MHQERHLTRPRSAYPDQRAAFTNQFSEKGNTVDYINRAASDQGPQAADTGLGFGDPASNGSHHEATEENPFDNPAARANAEQHRAKEDRTQARKKTLEDRCAQWGSFHYDAAILGGISKPWTAKLAAKISRTNARRDPAKAAPQLIFSGDEAVNAGASDADLKALPKLDDAQYEVLAHEAEVQRQYLLKRAAAEGAQRLAREQLRAEGYVPPADSVFDFARDFTALRAPEPLIPGLIETGSAVQVIAAPGVGKTFLAAGWACALASRGRSVVYVVGDDSTYQFVRRVLGWCVAHEMDPREVFAKLTVITRPMQFADDADMNAVVEMAGANESDMVVFDTLHQCSAGLVENSNDDARVITAGCRRIIATGSAAVLVHHATDDGRSGRGAKSVLGFVDTLLDVTGVEQDGRRSLKVTSRKQNNMETGKSVLYPFDRVEIPAELRGGVIADGDAWTLVARTLADPFDTVSGHAKDILEDIKLYGVLWSLRDVPRPLLSSRVHTVLKEHLMPILKAKGHLHSDARQMPRGFGRGEIDKLLAALSKVEPADARLIEESADSTTRTVYYELTERGRAELASLADNLRIGGGSPENDV